MKVFISSVIVGFESFREAAADAVRSLDFQIVRAEDFGPSDSTPQQACLEAARDADVVVLLLGQAYGPRQPSGLSATHEEYREARGHRPVLAFVQESVAVDHEQADFIREVRDWESGKFTIGFSTSDELRRAVTLALHRHTVSAAMPPPNEKELIERADDALESSSPFSSGAQLVLSLASAPRQEILRPGELEDPSFARRMQHEALFGTQALLSPDAGLPTELRGDWLILSQGSASIEIQASGALVVRQPPDIATNPGLGSLVLIEEGIKEQISRALRFAAVVLDRIDPQGRLSHAAIAASLVDVGYRAWRTRAEHARSPTSIDHLGGSHERVVVHLTPGIRRRSEIAYGADELANDIMVLLRRGFTS